jgi:hypothetical protein
MYPDGFGGMLYEFPRLKPGATDCPSLSGLVVKGAYKSISHINESPLFAIRRLAECREGPGVSPKQKFPKKYLFPFPLSLLSITLLIV